MQRLQISLSKINLTTPRHSELCSPGDLADLAHQVMVRCDQAAAFTEEPGKITRTFLSPPMRGLHTLLTSWMNGAGMSVRLDAAGNLIGRYDGCDANRPVLLIGSHLDSVPDGGKYDGVLGVLLGVAAVQALGDRRLPFGIDVIGFSEEEGVRFRAPFLGSRAICGQFDHSLLNRLDARESQWLRHFATSGWTLKESPKRPIRPAASAAIWRGTSSKGRCSTPSGFRSASSRPSRARASSG